MVKSFQNFKLLRLFIFIVGLIFLVGSVLADEDESGKKSEKKEEEVPALVGYSATYINGSASFNPKTKLHVSHTGDAYTFTPDKGGEAWVVPVKSIRGTIIYDKGVWFYWFDGSYNTLNCNLQMQPADAMALSSEVTEAVKGANTDPFATQEGQYKTTFEEYQKKALEESK